MSQDRWRGTGWLVVAALVAVLFWRSTRATNAPAPVIAPAQVTPLSTPAIDMPAPTTAWEVAIVMHARRRAELDDLRAGRGSVEGQQILQHGIAEYQTKQTNASIAEAKDASLRHMEAQIDAIFADPGILQQMQTLVGQVRVQSQAEAVALANERARQVPQPNSPPVRPMSDAELTSLIVGAWRQTNADGISTTISFQTNNTWSMYVSSTNPLINLPALAAGEVSGLWSIRNGQLGMECKIADGALIGVFVIGRTIWSPVVTLNANAIQLTGVEGDPASRSYQRIR